jgi:hypothetical protein
MHVLLLVVREGYGPQMTDRTTSAESSPSAELINRLIHGPVLNDLHVLAWVDSFNNSADGGKWDPGWSCRDHAVVLAALMTVEGLSAHVVRGASIYIQGPTSSGEEPTGLGNVLEAGGGHTWVDVPTFGTVDVSPRLDVRVAHWRPIPVSGLVGTEWEVPGLASHVAVVESAGRYEEAVTQATRTFDTATAIYWPQEVERFHVGMLDVSYVDSPLTHRLSDHAGSDCYIKLTAHLIGLTEGVRRPLARVNQRKAWRFLNEVDQALIDEMLRRIEAQ